MDDDFLAFTYPVRMTCRNMRLVVIADTGGVLRDIGAGDLTPRSLQDEAAAIGQAGDRLPTVLWECGSAQLDRDQIFSPLPTVAAGPGR